MFRIDIFINYYEDGTHNIKEIYINNIRKAKFENDKTDLTVLKDYEGYYANVTANHINDIAKNETYKVKITSVETDPVLALKYDRL